MTAADKKKIIEILGARKGDDLYRAQSAFRGQDLDQLYGESGKTKRQIIERYEQHEREIDRLMAAVEGAQ